MQICPQCHTEYDDTRKFCPHEGSLLEPTTANTETVNTTDDLKTDENLRTPQAGQKKITKRIGLGLVATLLLVSGVFGYRKARQESLPTPALQAEKRVAAANTVQASLPLKEPLKEQPASPPVETETVSTPEPTGAVQQEERHAVRPVPEKPKPKLKIPVGLYQVTATTPLRSKPRADASVVTQLQTGIKVRVVAVAGDYLEVHSRKGRTPGYIHQKDVVLLRSE